MLLVEKIKKNGFFLQAEGDMPDEGQTRGLGGVYKSQTEEGVARLAPARGRTRTTWTSLRQEAHDLDQLEEGGARLEPAGGRGSTTWTPA